jgi:hypothetical protein
MPDVIRDPITPEEWQEAVDMAEFLLLLESAKMYGLISFESKISPKRCCQIIERGAAKGYTPASESALIRRFLVPA